MTYPDSQVQTFVEQHFVPVRLVLNDDAAKPLFRQYGVLWTPTVGVADRRGKLQYQSPGFLPPTALLDAMRLGLGRALLAWARYDEAAEHFGSVADTRSAQAPEALYWQGVAWYLKARRRAPMMVAWNRLRAEYPDSVWALRVPPNQETFEEQ